MGSYELSNFTFDNVRRNDCECQSFKGLGKREEVMNIVFSVVLYRTPVSTIKKIIHDFGVLRNESEYALTLVLFENGSNISELNTYLIETAKKCPGVKVLLSKDNLGFGGGHNFVFDQIKSQYFVVMNPDIQGINTRDFDETINYLVMNPEVGLLVPKLVNPDGSVQLTNKLQSTVFDQAIRLLGGKFFKKRRLRFVQASNGYTTVMPTKNAHGAFMIFRSSTFESIKGFDERYFLYMEDTDITMKVNSISQSVYYPFFSVVHEWQQANRKISGVREMLKSMIKYYNKWGWKLF